MKLKMLLYKSDQTYTDNVEVTDNDPVNLALKCTTCYAYELFCPTKSETEFEDFINKHGSHPVKVILVENSRDIITDVDDETLNDLMQSHLKNGLSPCVVKPRNLDYLRITEDGDSKYNISTGELLRHTL